MGGSQKRLSLAKISCPEAGNIVTRRRLFQRLDNIAGKPLLWVTAPSGSGKTTLLSSYIQQNELPCIWYRCDEGDADLSTFFYYMSLAAKKAAPRYRTSLPLLTPEYMYGLPVFTKRYFGELFGRLHRSSRLNRLNRLNGLSRFMIVLDNYQAIPADSMFHEMLVSGLDVMPEGITMTILSRHEPPAWFGRLSANSSMSLIGWNEMKFTLEETSEVIRTGASKGLSRKAVFDLQKKTDGWGAAIVLMVETDRLNAEEKHYAGQFMADRIFDYFATEIFSKTEKEVQEFLLKTAFLPAVSVPLAEQLSDNRRAGSILSELNRHNYFTDRLAGVEEVYQYHPLFRDFLLSRAEKTCSGEELRNLQACAAALLEKAGMDDEAMDLYLRAGENGHMVRLVLSKAGELHSQGRYATLRRWLSRLTEQIVRSNPALLYLRGISCLDHDLRQGMVFFEQAFRGFTAANIEEGSLRSWAGVVETISILNDGYADLDPWIEWLDGRLGDVISFPSMEIEAQVVPQMVIALTVRQPDHPRLSLWRQRIEMLMRNSAFDASQRIVFATYLVGSYFIHGHYNRAGALLREMRPFVSEKKTLPYVFIRWQFAEASNAAYTGRTEGCPDHIAHALEVSSRTGIHVFDALLLYVGAQGCIRRGQSQEAGEFLTKLDSLPYLPANVLAEYHMASAAKCLLEENERAASEHYGIASGIYHRTGNRLYATIAYACSAMLWLSAGELSRAEVCLKEARGQEVADLPVSGLALRMAEALYALSSNDTAKGLELIRAFLALGREHGTVPLPYCPRRAQSLLLAKALEEGIETEYAKELIRQQGLRPELSMHVSDDWPWPFRIYTMGRFQILRHDVAIEFAGKTPQKPLELLKALIAFGGRDLPVEKITDVLWPEADGDLARQSFESALSRLRKLLGEDDLIIHRARQLSLDMQRCWVDSLALEHLSERSEKAAGADVAGLYREIAALYKGHFLPADEASEWVVFRSELLRNRALEIISMAAGHFQQQGHWQEAIDCCRKGLELDPLTEEFYRHLMICYSKLGRRAEALKLYNRCKGLLKDGLGLQPSPETEEVYSSIINLL